MERLQRLFHYWIDVVVMFVTPIYMIWSSLAILSNYSSLLSTVASRGKTRHMYDEQHQQHRQHQHIQNKDASTGKITTTAKNSSSSNNDILLSNMWVPKSYFSHFYDTGILCTLLSIIYVNVSIFRGTQQRNYLPPPTTTTTTTTTTIPVYYFVVVWVLTLLHLVRRKYECMYVHQWKRPNSSTMHILTYLGGMMHYMILPLTTIIPIRLDDGMDHGDIPESSISWSFVVVWSMSIVLNLYAQYEQYQHHVILANLRLRQRQNQKQRPTAVQDQVGCVKKNDVAASSSPSTTTLDDHDDDGSIDLDYYYRIPTERWFQYIACPHYFAEILIYLSLVMLIECTIPTSSRDMAQLNLSIDINKFYEEYYSSECWKTILLSNKQHLQILACIYSLLCYGSLYRHWWLLVWVTSNLSSSAYTNLEWNRRRMSVLLLSLSSSNQAAGEKEEEEECSIEDNPREVVDMIRNQKAIIPWIY